MTKYYFTFKISNNKFIQYVAITAEGEQIAKDVFHFMYGTNYVGIYKTEPQGENFKLYEQLIQRQTEQ